MGSITGVSASSSGIAAATGSSSTTPAVMVASKSGVSEIDSSVKPLMNRNAAMPAAAPPATKTGIHNMARPVRAPISPPPRDRDDASASTFSPRAGRDGRFTLLSGDRAALMAIAMSPAVWNRFLRFFSIAFITTSASASGASGRSSETGVGSSYICACSTATGVWDSNGTLPARAW